MYMENAKALTGLVVPPPLNNEKNIYELSITQNYSGFVRQNFNLTEAFYEDLRTQSGVE